MPDLKAIADILLKEKLIDSKDTASPSFSIKTSGTPLPFEQIWNTYSIRLRNAENNTALKEQFIRFVSDLEKHKGKEETLKLVNARGCKQNVIAFMDAGYSKVICYLFVL